NACESSLFKHDENLSAIMTGLSKGKIQHPLAVLTMVGSVAIADSVLAWGIFLRQLSSKLDQRKANVADATAREIFGSLQAVRGANLPSVKICAAYGKTWKNISPWKTESPDGAPAAGTKG